MLKVESVEDFSSSMDTLEVVNEYVETWHQVQDGEDTFTGGALLIMDFQMRIMLKILQKVKALESAKEDMTPLAKYLKIKHSKEEIREIIEMIKEIDE